MTEPWPRFFFSTFEYGACKLIGADAWPGVLKELLEHPDRGPEKLGRFGLSFATLWEARHIADVVTHVASNSYIPRARCVAAAHFLRGIGKDCDVWVTCDDDTWVDESVLRQLLRACRATRGLVALPSTNRDGHSMCFHGLGQETQWVDKVPVRTVAAVGQGLVAMHRNFLSHLDVACPRERRFLDRPGGLDCAGLFLAGPVHGNWLGEDYYLCYQAQNEHLPLHLLLEASVQHEDLCSMVDLEGRVCLQGATPEATAAAVATMTEAVRAFNAQEALTRKERHAE